jgi:translocation and assembly module TamA
VRPPCSGPGFAGARSPNATARTVLLALLLLYAASAAGNGAVKYRVQITAPSDLTSLLESNLDIVRWSTREEVSEDELRQLFKTAPRQVRDLLATEGYFSPTVESALDTGQETWVVRLTVWPGEPTRVVGMNVQVMGEIDADPARQQRREQAREAFGIQDASVFRQADWESAKQRALHSLHRKRYAAARIVESRADIDPQAHTARLSVQIDSGPPFTFGSVRVTGLDRYPQRIVTNLNPIRPGSPYDEEELLKYQRRLQASGYFASVVVAAESDPARADGTPIRVNVVEGAARKLELGVGFSTDRGLRGQAQYTDKNTLDRALRFSGSVKLDRLSQEAVAGLSLPRNAQGHVYGLEGKYNFQDIQGEQRTDWSITGARTFTIEERESQQSLQFLTESRTLADGTKDDRKALYAAQTWRWNNLDDLLVPRRGYFLSVQVGGAAEALLSDRSFGRLYGKGTYLLPVHDFGTLVLRAEAGAVLAQTRENIPSAYLFRTGGDTTVRGYAFESLGVAEGDAIVGGRYLGLGSVEYIQWIKPQWGAAVFVDAGNAVDEIEDFRAALGYGIGARWSSPIGSLNLDLAYGEEVNEWRVHFSVGIVLR